MSFHLGKFLELVHWWFSSVSSSLSWALFFWYWISGIRLFNFPLFSPCQVLVFFVLISRKFTWLLYSTMWLKITQLYHLPVLRLRNLTWALQMTVKEGGGLFLFLETFVKNCSLLVQAVGKIQFLVIVGLRSVCIPLMAVSWGLLQLPEVAYISWLMAPFLHLQSQMCVLLSPLLCGISQPPAWRGVLSFQELT